VNELALVLLSQDAKGMVILFLIAFALYPIKESCD